MKRPVLFTILLSCVTFIVPAQNNRLAQETPFFEITLFSTQELENRRFEALKAIELTTQLLSETSANAKISLNRLNLLAQQLISRKKVVAILEQEIAEIDHKIKTMSDEIELLDKDLKKTKENYAKSMQNQQQEHRSAQFKMLLILSAENLSQTYRRLRYLREYAGWQKEEGERIISKQNELISRKEELEKTRQEKQDLLTERENENKKLVTEEQQQQKEVRELNTKQKDLQRLLEQKRKEADALNKRIEQLIVEDIKNSEKNLAAVMAEQATTEQVTDETVTTEKTSEETASTEIKPSTTTASEPAQKETAPLETASTESTTTTTETFETAASTAEASPSASKDSYVLLGSEVLLSKEFENSKGKLPFPLTGKYTIVSSFGEHQHQELSYVRTNNNGIDIQTTAGTEACAIFKGVVTRVFVMPGFNNNVIIRHGNFLTVYSNLSDVYIKAGDIVNTSQIIGKIYTDAEKGNETILHFQIWKERTKLNPAAWIK